jgi:hypothetical protein
MRHHRQLTGFIALLIGLALLFGGCASTYKGLVISGDSLVSLATQFDVVSKHMTAACVAKTYTVQTCASYRTFGEKFKQAYPATKTLWNAATQFEDKGLAAAAQDSFAKLAADLAPFLAMIGGK